MCWGSTTYASSVSEVSWFFSLPWRFEKSLTPDFYEFFAFQSQLEKSIPMIIFEITHRSRIFFNKIKKFQVELSSEWQKIFISTVVKKFSSYQSKACTTKVKNVRLCRKRLELIAGVAEARPYQYKIAFFFFFTINTLFCLLAYTRMRGW